jgi:hypothetical protein
MPQDTYAALMNKKLVVPSAKTSYVAVDRAFFAALLAQSLTAIDLDEDWYLKHSPDVREAIERKEFKSAVDHYVKVGFFEHRMPYEIEVDDEWYLENYPDIAEAVKKGIFESGRAHFYQLGFREGRFPHPNFAIRTVQ